MHHLHPQCRYAAGDATFHNGSSRSRLRNDGSWNGSLASGVVGGAANRNGNGSVFHSRAQMNKELGLQELVPLRSNRSSGNSRATLGNKNRFVVDA